MTVVVVTDSSFNYGHLPPPKITTHHRAMPAGALRRSSTTRYRAHCHFFAIIFYTLVTTNHGKTSGMGSHKHVLVIVTTSLGSTASPRARAFRLHFVFKPC